MAADFNGDGKVDIQDLILFIQHYGMRVPTADTMMTQKMAAASFDMIPPEFAAMFGLVAEPEEHVDEMTEVVTTALPVNGSAEEDDTAEEYVAPVVVADIPQVAAVIPATEPVSADPKEVFTVGAHIQEIVVRQFSAAGTTAATYEAPAVLASEPISVSLPQVGEVRETISAAPAVEPMNDIRLAIHQPHTLRAERPLRLPTVAVTRDMHHLLWDAYDAFRQADAGAALLPQGVQAASRQQKLLELLFAEEHVEEKFSVSEAEFYQPIRAGL